MSAPDVFLSYNREDAEVAECFRAALTQAGLDVWWDASLRSGEAYDEVTETALRGAKAVVVLWSPRSVASRWVRAEATIADRNGTLVPATIAPCDRPVMFELTQTTQLSHWRGEPQDPTWTAFLADVRRKVRGGSAVADAPPPATTPAAQGEVPYVAVLPFGHRQDDDILAVIAEELTEDITRELAQNSFFKVLASGATAALRGKPLNYRTLRQELGAAYFAEGKLQRNGAGLMLRLQLVDGETTRMIWSKPFLDERDHTRPSDEFSVLVACELGEHIIQIETRRAMSKQGPLSGWEHALRAMSLLSRMGPASQLQAHQEAVKAVEAAPELGLAHALAATMDGPIAAAALAEIDGSRRQVIHDHIKRAMELDGDNPELLHFVSTAYASLEDPAAALRLARRAVELAPNSPLTRFSLGGAYFALGRTAEAIAEFREELRLASTDLYRPIALMLLAISLCVEGEAAEAEDVLDHSLALNPDYCVALMWKALAAAQQGREAVAREAIARMREAEPGMSLEQHVRLLVYYAAYRERLAVTADLFRRLWHDTKPASPTGPGDA